MSNQLEETVYSSPLQNLLESEEMSLFVEHNTDLINEINEDAVEFTNVIAEFVYNNPEVFVDSSVDDISKNIRIFSEIAMAQFLAESTSMYQEYARIVEPITPENALDEYV